MTLVVDASVVIAALFDTGKEGRWAEGMLASDVVAAPELLIVEATNVIRRLEQAREISEDQAQVTLDELVTLPVQYVSMLPMIDQMIALRHNVTAYDAAYVAAAETLGAPLATLDIRLSRTTDRCAFVTPADA